MKTILYILLFHISAISFAQDPQLFQNTWYLQNVIIDGQDNFPPVNSEVPFVPLNFYLNGNDDFMTHVCNSFSGRIIYDGIQSFSIQEYALTLILCDMEENTIFEGIYLSFFFNQVTQDPYIDPFPYIISDDGSEKTLIIEYVNGDQAIYGDHLLSREDFYKSNFAIHPNPVKNELFLTSKNTTANLKIKIFNLEGKLLSIQNKVFENQISIDVSQLMGGIYFLNIEDENGNTTIKKFIKE